jgi:SAM-dependent methyltransferase
LKQEIYKLTYELEESYWWYIARRKIIMDQLHSLFMNKHKKPLLLDVGCGTGKNLIDFSEFFETYGVDASIEAINFCRRRGLNNIKILDSFNTKLIKNPFHKKFDMITMLDVLEHIQNDIQYLKIIKKWLKKDGMLFLTVPAYQWLWSGEDHVSNHFRRYSKKQLLETISRSGFTIKKISYFNTFLFPLQAFTLLMKRWLFPESINQTNLHEMPKIINELLERIMSAELPFLKTIDFHFGGSILCICQK